MRLATFAGAGAALSIMLAVLPAVAQMPAPVTPAVPQATRYLSSRIFPQLTLERYLETWRNEFRQADADANGVVDEADMEMHRKAAASMLRVSYLGAFLPADLDGDGAVTEHEFRLYMNYTRRMTVPRPSAQSADPAMEGQLRQFKTIDGDGDGRVTIAELLKAATSGPESAAPTSQITQHFKAILVFAPEGKTSVTLADIEPMAEALFKTADTDGDGKLSADEVKAYQMRPGQPGARQRLAAEEAMKQREEARRKAESERVRKEKEANAACAMPKASEQAKVVLFSAYQTQALSTTTIGFQDVAVGVGNVTIEPGAEPIYLVISMFRPTIWRFSGAVERLERVVLTSTMTGGGRGIPNEKPLTGAMGLPVERIAFLGQSKCLGYFSETPSTQSAMAAAVVRKQAGKEAQVVASHYGVSGVRVPSGQIESVRDENQGKLVIVKPSGSLRIEGDASNYVIQTGPSNLINDLRMYSPGGVISIDPAKVVSSLPAERYEVLPQQAGLLQLVRAGALEQNRSGEYLIKKKIRFPAELNGAHSVKFLLLRGVPMPEGNPGHSEVISEETGEKLKFGQRG